MKSLLLNPVYHALLTGDQHLCFGTDAVKFFDDEVSPFVGFHHLYANGFSDLHELLPSGRKILYANPSPITEPVGWQIKHAVEGTQFIYEGRADLKKDISRTIPLTEIHVPQMLQLAELTKPGPFAARTIAFGSYFGIFENEQLVAMTGQRLHVGPYTEISAVCTHPDHLGKGYASILLQQQLQLIMQNGQQPFLHVRADNTRAIDIYKRLGFVTSGPMHFYFMERI